MVNEGNYRIESSSQGSQFTITYRVSIARQLHQAQQVKISLIEEATRVQTHRTR